MHDAQIPWRLIFLIGLKLAKILGIIPGGMAAYWVRKSFQRWRQRHAQEGWPAAEGTILWGKVRIEGRRRIWAEITYSYFVEEYRSGTYLRLFRREEEADEFIRRIKDKKLQIRFKVSDPETSTILDRDLDVLALSYQMQ